MEWILEKLPVLIFILVFLAQIVRGVLRSRNEAKPGPVAKHDTLAEQRRAQEIQAEIRRKIAERRAGQFREPVAPQGEPPAPPPVMRRDPTAIPDPFGGPMRRMLEEFERRTQPVEPPPISPLSVERRNAELERQERIADELRAAEDARVVAQRRARQAVAASELEARSPKTMRTAARGRLMADLRDPESLRRAIVLREVLGTPAGLRNQVMH